MSSNKSTPLQILYLCSGFIKHHYPQSFPISLLHVIISYFIINMKLCFDNLHFSTLSVIAPSQFPINTGLLYFSSILMSFLVQNPTFNLQIRLNKSLKIDIWPSLRKYRLNNNNQYKAIKSISQKLWNFSTDTFIFIISITRKTSCQCRNTQGVIQIYICSKFQNNTESLQQQIIEFKGSEALIEISLDEDFNYHQKNKLLVTTNNADKMIICDNDGALFCWNKQSQRQICCHKALHEYVQ